MIAEAVAGRKRSLRAGARLVDLRRAMRQSR
jgi:hypothetical protein